MQQKGFMVMDMKKYENFQLDWNINDIDRFNQALDAIDEWAGNSIRTGVDVTVKDIINEIQPDLYDELSRGDKCRVGRAVSYKYNNNCYDNVERGNKKGATNTYRL